MLRREVCFLVSPSRPSNDIAGCPTGSVVLSSTAVTAAECAMFAQLWNALPPYILTALPIPAASISNSSNPLFPPGLLMQAQQVPAPPAVCSSAAARAVGLAAALVVAVTLAF